MRMIRYTVCLRARIETYILLGIEPNLARLYHLTFPSVRSFERARPQRGLTGGVKCAKYFIYSIKYL